MSLQMGPKTKHRYQKADYFEAHQRKDMPASLSGQYTPACEGSILALVIRDIMMLCIAGYGKREGGMKLSDN